jgi:hypothetical protein
MSRPRSHALKGLSFSFARKLHALNAEYAEKGILTPGEAIENIFKLTCADSRIAGGLTPDDLEKLTSKFVPRAIEKYAALKRLAA